MSEQAAKGLGLPRCCQCGEVIGMYEPMVVLAGSQSHTTSRAAHVHSDQDGQIYHRACYTQAQPTAPA